MKDERPDQPRTVTFSHEYMFLVNQYAKMSADMMMLKGFIGELKNKIPNPTGEVAIIIEALSNWAMLTNQLDWVSGNDEPLAGD